MNKHITVIIPYYNQPQMLKVQQQSWALWPDELAQKTDIILVDDGSQRDPATENLLKENGQIVCGRSWLRVYRVLEDVRWNWIACRNIGAHEASAGWLMMTDIDHIITPELLARLHSITVDPNCFYIPSRVDGPNRTPNPKPHPNSYFMHRSLFWAVGGYDENYSGHYGTDGIWKRRCLEHGKRVMLDIPLVQYLPEHVHDCRVSLDRKSDEQRQAVLNISAQKLEIKTLSFPYERVL